MNEKLRAAIAEELKDLWTDLYSGVSIAAICDQLERRISREFCLFYHQWIYDDDDKRFCRKCGVAKEEA